MPQAKAKPIWFFAALCESVLNEKDNTLSAIRIVDIFRFHRNPKVPLEEQPILMRILVMSRLDPSDRDSHIFELSLIRPGGEVSPFGDPFTIPELPGAPEVPGHPRGINLISTVGVVARTFGLHYVKVDFDGQELTRVPFSLLSSVVSEDNQKR